MKKYFVLHIVVFACLAQTSFSQMQINDLLVQKKPLLQIPMVHITPVESLFVPVHIDTIKPFVMSIGTEMLAKQQQAACARLKKLKATLVLKAERTNDITANLKWDTKYAFYASGFNVERSLGDSLHFSTINFTVASKEGGFKKTYHLPDHNDYSGVSFYRIKQRNGDHGFAYSNIVSVKGYQQISLNVYPVPASNRVTLNITPKQSGNLAIIVYDPAGKIVQQQSAACTVGTPLVQSINISRLAAGLYRLKIAMPDKTFLTGKFMKE